HEKSHQIFANRGVSGIDGNIATVVGIAHAIKRPILAILGDQTFLHDLNSLALLKKCPYPVLLLVVNNAGGAIFSFLPIASKKELLDDYFAATHDLTFQKAAELFQIPYLHLTTEKELFTALSEKKSMIIELQTDRKENFHFHQEIARRCSISLQEVR
ncbi:MAG: thiamine pyrophosphate-dependent enzyme, partial [Chlamydiales bacterium]